MESVGSPSFGSQRPALHQPEAVAPRLRLSTAERRVPRALAGARGTDKTSLKLRHEIGIDIIAWECDYPHSDCFWPDAPEQVLAELNAAGADDPDINKITWENPAGSSAGTRSHGRRASRRPSERCAPRPPGRRRVDQARAERRGFTEQKHCRDLASRVDTALTATSCERGFALSAVSTRVAAAQTDS